MKLECNFKYLVTLMANFKKLEIIVLTLEILIYNKFKQAIIFLIYKAFHIVNASSLIYILTIRLNNIQIQLYNFIITLLSHII